MTTYDNLNIAQTTIIFDSNGNPSVASGTFDLSTMTFLPNVPLIDQIEVERVFDTGADTKFGTNEFTIADRRQLFIFPKNWYSINEQTKVLTFVDLNTIPVGSSFEPFKFYPESRSFLLALRDENGDEQYIDIPDVHASTTAGPPVRQYDKVFIRRKTLSLNSIVTFAPGTRLTTTQLNLQFDQLKYLVQEIVAKIRNEVILKYDENAVDGPFLGNGDLKMNNNFIKDVGSKEITDTATFFIGQDNILYSGGTFTANVLSVKNAVTKGALYRADLVAGTPTFTGDFTTRLPGSATDYKITNLSPGTAATDAVNLSQLNNADNLTTGTVAIARLPANIPLSKLSSVVGQTYTLPLENLPSSLSTAAGTFGQLTASNTNNMVSMVVNSKGILTNLAHRNMTVDDLPVVSGLVAQSYGGIGKLLTVSADTKGRITSISAATITTSDLPNTAVTAGSYGAISGTSANALTRFTVDSKGNITAAAHRSIEVNDLPTTSVAGAGTYGQATATNVNNMIQVAYDAKGRTTVISHRNMGIDDLPGSIPLTKLSNALSQSYILPKDAIADGSILITKLDTVTAGQPALPVSFIPSGIILSKIDPATPGAFVLPDTCLSTIGTIAAGAYSTQPVKDITVDTKGRITAISQRAITSGDIPALSASAISITTSPFADALIPPLAISSAGSYGSTTTIPTFTVDTKGRVTAAANSVVLSTAHISNFSTNTNTLIDARALSLGVGSFFNAGTKLISNVLNPVSDQDVTTKKWIVDNYQSLSGFNAAALTQIQANAVYWDSVNSRFTALRSAANQHIFGVATPTLENHAANKAYIDTALTSYTTTATLNTPIDARLATNSVFLSAGSLSAGTKKIVNVVNPTDAQDVVTKNYLEANTIYATGSNLSAGNKYLTDMIMRPAGSLTSNDAVNFGYIETAILNAGGTVVGTAAPQVFKQTWASANTITAATPATTSFVRYRFNFVDPTNPIYATSSAMILIDAEGGTRVFTPNAIDATAGTVYDGYFWLDTSGGGTKILNVYVSATPTGSITIRNFGLSRVVSGGIATTSSTGLVSITPGNDGGISVTGLGAIALIPATDLQIGGIKQGTGLTITAGVAAVNLTNTINTTSSTTAASATAVNTLRLASMLIDGSIQMTGKLRTATATTAIASLSIPPSAATLGTLVNGDLWNLNDVLQFRTTSATKQIAYRDAATISALGLVQISTGNDSGLSITGPGVLSIVPATSTVLGGIKQGTGLTVTSGVAAVNLSSSLTSTLTDTAATSSAAKTIYDYAVTTNTALTTLTGRVTTLETTTVPAVATTANNALARSGGTMTGMIQLPGSTTSLAPLRFVGGSAPTSPTAGDVWWESNTLKMRVGVATKDLAFTDSPLTGNAATATKLATAQTISLTGDVTGSVSFDGSAAVSISTTIAANSVALGTDTTGNYLATAAGTDGVSVTGSGSEGAGITIANTDKGSSQAIFKTITPSSGTSVVAATNASTLNLTAGSGITVTGSGSTITIANSATSPNTFGTVAVSGQTSVAADTSADTLTLVAGTGMSITTDAGAADSVTFNNTGVTSITGTANQVTVTGTTTPTLSLPQNIHSGATPTFAGATLGSVIITSGAANTLTTTGNLDLILDPAGTGKISLLANVDCSTNTLTAGASTLGTLSCDAITFKTTGTKLKLGTTDSTVEAISTASAGIYAVGDLVLRAPVSGKAFLVYSPSTAPALADAIITKSAMDTAISTATSGFMTNVGAIRSSTGDQTFGTTLGSFIVSTAGVAKLTIVNSGAATFANTVTVASGLIVSGGGLSITGASTLAGLTVTGSAVTASTAPTTGNHLTNKTYVDDKILASDLLYDTSLLKLNRDRALGSLGSFSIAGTTVVTVDLTSCQIGVPTFVKFFTGGGAASTGSAQIELTSGESFYLLSKASSGTNFTIIAATPFSPPIAITPTMYNVDITNTTAPAATSPASPTLINTVGLTALATCTGGSIARTAGFCILRVS